MSDSLVPAGWRFRLLALSLKRLPFLRYVWLRRAFLKTSGWVASMHANVPVDCDGRPVAWYTYAALHFLEPRIHSEMEVFEYGAGHSTLWWTERVGHVCSVESDEAWVTRLAPKLPANADLKYEPLVIDGAYARSASARSRQFDVIVIDGFDRNNCARRCLGALKPDGVIVWDNADWSDRFADGFALLEQEGFRRLDFAGIGPLNGYGWSTAVFYRPGRNCLAI